MKQIAPFAVLALMAAAGAASAQPALPSIKVLTTPLAVEAAQAAAAACAAEGFRVAVAFADRGGAIRLLIIDDGASINAGEIAKRKAHTSAVMRSNGDALVERLKTAPQLQTAMEAVDPMFQAAGGGVPIIVDREVIAAIGVSGAPAGKDGPCADAGLAKIASRLK